MDLRPLVDSQIRRMLSVLRVNETDRLIVDSGCHCSGGQASRHALKTPSRSDARQDPPPAKQVRGPTPHIEIEDEPAPKLIVDPSLPGLLD